MSARLKLARAVDRLAAEAAARSYWFKEVIQPQVPLRLPCYDLVPVMDHTVVTALLERLGQLLLVQPTPMT